jgi:glutaredoxin
MCSIWADETTTAMTRHTWLTARSLILATTLLYLAPVQAEAQCNKRVTMYNAWWCPYCRQVRAILARNHIRYTMLDATSARVQAVMIRKFGDTAVPRTVIGGVLVEGVDEDRIKQLCRG